MNCFYCKGSLKESLTNHVVNLKNGIIIVKNVPCSECIQCGETVYSDEIAMRLEAIVEEIRAINIPEVAIVSFSERVA